jgi:protein TonB
VHELLGDMASLQAEPDMDLAEDALQRFFSTIRRKIESKKKYPAAAQKAEIEGRAGVRMTILKDGQLEKAEIEESSGYDILDRAALRSVREAAPFPPIPEAARLDKVNVSIHLVFKLS